MNPSRVRRVRTAASNTVQVTITVAAEVVDGRVSSDDLAVWVEDAIRRYHIFRAGFVGTGDLCGGIKMPRTLRD